MTETEPALDDGECVYFIGKTSGVRHIVKRGAG